MASQQHVGLMPWQECWEIIRGTFITINGTAGFHAINKGNDQLSFSVAVLAVTILIQSELQLNVTFKLFLLILFYFGAMSVKKMWW